MRVEYSSLPSLRLGPSKAKEHRRDLWRKRQCVHGHNAMDGTNTSSSAICESRMHCVVSVENIMAISIFKLRDVEIAASTMPAERKRVTISSSERG